MRKKALFQAGEEDQRKLQALGGVQGHQCDAGLGVELVGVGGQSRVVEKLAQGLAAGFGIVGGVGQFLQVFNAAEGLRRAFGLQGFDVAGAVDEEADQLREGGRVAGFAKGRLFLRFFAGVRFEFWIVDPRSQNRDLGHPVFFRHSEKGPLGLSRER